MRLRSGMTPEPDLRAWCDRRSFNRATDVVGVILPGGISRETPPVGQAAAAPEQLTGQPCRVDQGVGLSPGGRGRDAAIVGMMVTADGVAVNGMRMPGKTPASVDVAVALADPDHEGRE